MTLRFPKDILISCAIHILCVAGLLMSGFNPTDHTKNIPHIKPNEMVFTIETAAAIVPAAAPVPASPKVLKPAPAPTPKVVHKKEQVKKIVHKAVKPKTIVKKITHKAIKKPSAKTAKAVSQKTTSQNKATTKSTQRPTASGAAKFNKNNYIAHIKKRIAQFKHYPNSAKRRGIEGRVALQISVSK